MPPFRFWLHAFGEGLIPFLTACTALWSVALADQATVPFYSYLIALAGGIVQGWREGARTWPSDTMH
jgi:hypothetical protein